jgi:hypothetical protein
MKMLWRYIAHDDPLVATTNLAAVVLGYNTPLYPLYLLWVTGHSGLPWSLLTLCSCPFFLAVPALARLSPRFARIMLPVIGALNTIFCTWLLGPASGTELFLIPSITLAALSFRAGERASMVIAAAPAIVAFFLSGHYGATPLAYSAAQSHAILRLNAASVGTLSLFIGVIFARLYQGTDSPA